MFDRETERGGDPWGGPGGLLLGDEAGLVLEVEGALGVGLDDIGWSALGWDYCLCCGCGLLCFGGGLLCSLFGGLGFVAEDEVEIIFVSRTLPSRFGALCACWFAFVALEVG